MATTTTFKLIRNQIVSVIEALTPATLNRPENKFRRLPDKTMKLDEWCLAHGNDGCFRKFDIRRTGGFGDPDILDPAALRRSFTATITVAYPVSFGLYGANDIDDLEDTIDSDVTQIREAVFSPGNLLAGHIENRVTVEDTDRSDDRVWFQRFTVEVTYYNAQTLT